MMEETPRRSPPVGWRFAFIAAWTILFALAAYVCFGPIPKSIDVFKNVGIPLPSITLSIISLSQFVHAYWFIFLLLWMGGVGMAASGTIDRLAPLGTILALVVLLLFGTVYWLGIERPMTQGLRMAPDR